MFCRYCHVQLSPLRTLTICRPCQAEYIRRHRENAHVREYATDYSRRRYATDPAYRFLKKTRVAAGKLLRYLAGLPRGQQSPALLRAMGVTIDQFRQHFDAELLAADLTWQGYGRTWVLDHQVPLKNWPGLVSYADPRFAQAWALTNLRPLALEEHLKKSASESPLYVETAEVLGAGPPLSGSDLIELCRSWKDIARASPTG